MWICDKNGGETKWSTNERFKIVQLVLSTAKITFSTYYLNKLKIYLQKTIRKENKTTGNHVPLENKVLYLPMLKAISSLPSDKETFEDFNDKVVKMNENIKLLFIKILKVETTLNR